MNDPNQKPPRVGEWRWSMGSGNGPAVISIPLDLEAADVDEIEQLFGLILRTLRRSLPTPPAVAPAAAD